MTRRCSCRQPLSEVELTAAYSIGVRIEHDVEPCLPSVEAVKIQTPFQNDPRPVLTRLPAIAGSRS